MKFGDQLSIDTPELVALEFPLAGIGSRFIAILIDSLLQAAIVLALIFGAMLFLPSLLKFEAASAKWFIAIVILVPFLLQWGYFALFEAFWNGQTPGKRVAKIRVIQQSGRAITLFESLARNLVRIIDFLPTSYIVGVISIFVTSRHQRLGDLVAGTLVVHEGQLSAIRPPWAIRACSPKPRRKRLSRRARRVFPPMRSAVSPQRTCRRSRHFSSAAWTWRSKCGSPSPYASSHRRLVE